MIHKHTDTANEKTESSQAAGASLLYWPEVGCNSNGLPTTTILYLTVLTRYESHGFNNRRAAHHLSSHLHQTV